MFIVLASCNEIKWNKKLTMNLCKPYYLNINTTIKDIIVWQKVKNTPPPFISVDTIIMLSSSAYDHYFFCYNIDKEEGGGTF